ERKGSWSLPKVMLLQGLERAVSFLPATGLMCCRPEGGRRRVLYLLVPAVTKPGISEMIFLRTSLTLLHLARNQLQALPPDAFAKLPRLRLDLGSNKLRSLPHGIFANLSSLSKLVLSHNQLEALPQAAFAGLAALTELNLDANKLSSLDHGDFASLPQLRTLSARKNQLQSVPAGLLQALGQLRAVYLSGNPWRCDCRLRGLHSWMQLSRTTRPVLYVRVPLPHLGPRCSHRLPARPPGVVSPAGLAVGSCPRALPAAAPSPRPRRRRAPGRGPFLWLILGGSTPARGEARQPGPAPR
uniref:LRRCT domain-containing protein n=1 Tax=Crocodylus porosus TaxID=8502 RepID=A0A7M4F2S8_CROPO